MAGLCLGGAENLVSGCGGKISPGGMGGFECPFHEDSPEEKSKCTSKDLQ